MRRLVAAIAVLLSLVSFPSPVPAMAQDSRCSAYDSWVWAQTELAPQSSEKVCGDLPDGLAPVTWTNTIPATAEPAEFISVTDGDTLTVSVGGQQDTVRLYRADAPEISACGGASATAFSNQVMALNSQGTTIYLESDTTERDRYDRRLSYVWLMIGDKTYMLNEALERSGYARDVDYGYRLYSSYFGESAAFAKKWGNGVYAECGGFDVTSAEAGGGGQAEEIKQQGPGAGQCDPSYPTVCIPPIEVTGDLDFGQIQYRRFEVIPPDPHGFDSDRDGVGCEGE